MTTITMRPFQEAAINRLRHALAPSPRGLGKRSPLLVSPTGSGKTRMFAYLVAKLVAAGKRVVVLDHRDELTEQISTALTDAGARHGLIVAGGNYYDPRITAHVASVFTLGRRLDRVEVPDYVIIDEAHHCIAGSTWGKVVDYWRELNPDLILIGVTATPERLGGEGLGQVFDCMVIGPSTADLIADGWLSPYTLFSPPGGADMTGVKRVAGDYNKAEANARVDKPTITGSAVAHYRRLLNGAPAVAFCGSVAHAEHVAAMFVSEGFRAASIDGKMDKALRRDAIRDFGAGRLNVLTSCDLISEGFDVPGIVGALLLRPTQSLALYLQQVGRALRPVYEGGRPPEDLDARLRAIACGPKPKAVIIDHVGNSGRLEHGEFIVNHGLPDDERQWSLDGRDRKAKVADPDAIALKQCPQCYAMNRALAQSCRECGKVFVVKARVLREVEGELAAVDVEAMRAQQRVMQGNAKDRDALAAVFDGNVKRADHVLAARAEKDQLRSAAQQAVDDCYRATGGQRMHAGLIRALKPKQLKELIVACMEQLHEAALAMDERRAA